MSSDPGGIDHTLDAELDDDQGREVPGSDAAADADPAEDTDQYAEAVEQQARESRAPEPPD
jgi:hypothetical protein